MSHIGRMWNRALLRAIRDLVTKQELVMATLADLQTKVTTLTTDVNTLITDFKTAQSGPDQAAIDAISSQLDTLQASVTAAITPAAPPAA